MAWTHIANRGTAVGLSRGLKHTTTTNSAVTAADNAVLVLTIAKDNTQTTNGSSTEVTALTDAGGNTWVKAGEFCAAGGAASAGAVVSVWYSKLTADLANGAGITATFAASCNAAASTLHHFTVAGNTELRVAGVSAQATTGAAVSMTLAGLPSKEYLFYRGIALEYQTFGITPTTNYTALGTNYADGGNTTSSMAVQGEFRILAATGDTSLPSNASADQASVFMALEEYTSAAAAVAFGSAATFIGTDAATGITISAPTSMAAGDFLLAALSWTSGDFDVSTAPAGWTSLRLTTSGGSNQISVHSYYKYASAGEAASWTWTLGGAGIQRCGTVWRITGANSASAMDASAGNFGQGSAVSATALTNNFNDSLICFFAGVSMDHSGITFTTPSGYVQNSTLLAGASNMAGFTKNQVGAGSTGNVVTSVSAALATDYWAAQLISLRPNVAAADPVQLATAHFMVDLNTWLRRRYPVSYTAFLNIDVAATVLVDATVVSHVNLARQHLKTALRQRPRTHSFFAAAPLSDDVGVPVVAPHTDTGQMQPRGSILPPNPLTDEAQWMRQASSWMREANQGHLANTGIITLAINATTTVVLDERVGPNSHIGFMARTANAAQELGNGTMYVSQQGNGQFVITHSFSAAADRTFVYTTLG